MSDHDAAEAAAMAQHYAEPAVPNPYTPDQPDALRDGLLRGHAAHRRQP